MQVVKKNYFVLGFLILQVNFCSLSCQRDGTIVISKITDSESSLQEDTVEMNSTDSATEFDSEKNDDSDLGVSDLITVKVHPPAELSKTVYALCVYLSETNHPPYTHQKTPVCHFEPVFSKDSPYVMTFSESYLSQYESRSYFIVAILNMKDGGNQVGLSVSDGDFWAVSNHAVSILHGSGIVNGGSLFLEVVPLEYTRSH